MSKKKEDSFKQKAIESLNRLPDDATADDMIYRLNVLKKLEKGRRAGDRGKHTSHEEIVRQARADEKKTA